MKFLARESFESAYIKYFVTWNIALYALFLGCFLFLVAVCSLFYFFERRMARRTASDEVLYKYLKAGYPGRVFFYDKKNTFVFWIVLLVFLFVSSLFSPDDALFYIFLIIDLLMILLLFKFWSIIAFNTALSSLATWVGEGEDYVIDFDKPWNSNRQHGDKGFIVWWFSIGLIVMGYLTYSLYQFTDGRGYVYVVPFIATHFFLIIHAINSYAALKMTAVARKFAKSDKPQ